MKPVTRRTISISVVCCTLPLLSLLSPVLLIVAVLGDLICRVKFAITRSLLFLYFFLFMECIGVLSSFLFWIENSLRPNQERFLHRNYALQNWWGVTIAKMGIRLFDVQLDIHKPFEITRRPVLVFMRHSSFIDTFLPILLISSVYKIHLKYVLKSELLLDPCLDIVGNRLPNTFVRRSGGDSVREIKAVKDLAHNLASNEGVLIYPEGTRYTEAKRERILKIMEKKQGLEYEYAQQYTTVLPPRLGGSMALLDEAQQADAVFCAHTGLEGTTDFFDILKGKMVGATIHVHFHTVDFESIPHTTEEKKVWFLNEWLVVDKRVSRMQKLP